MEATFIPLYFNPWYYLSWAFGILIVGIILTTVTTILLSFLVSFAVAFVIDLENRIRAVIRVTSVLLAMLPPVIASIVLIIGTIIEYSTAIEYGLDIPILWPAVVYSVENASYVIRHGFLVWYRHPIEEQQL